MLLDLINILTLTHTSAHVASKVFLRVTLAGADPLVLICIYSANAKKKESRRADSNRLPLLLTSDHSGVAGVCRGCKCRIFRGVSFPALLSVAPHCVPGGIRVVSSGVVTRQSRRPFLAMIAVPLAASSGAETLVCFAVF